MRIAMAGQTWGPQNGPGVFTRRLAARLALREHEVLSLVPATRLRSTSDAEGPVTVARIPAITVAPFYPEVRITPAPLRYVTRVLERFRPDLIHIQDHYLLSRAALNAACRMRIPVLATNHFIPSNILPHVPFSSRSPIAARIADRWLWKTLIEVLERTRLVATPTETAASILRPRLKAIAVRVISCGVDLDQFRPPTAAERRKARLRWRLGPDEVVFTYVGRLDFEKRVDLLIEALAAVMQTNIRLIVAGRGHELTPLRRLARTHKIAHRVVFLGFIDDFDLIDLLRASDCFVMPGDAELQSIATLEAMAAGLPVLAANARALPELIESGVNGELFEAGVAADAAEKLELLAGRRRHWPEMSAASRARAARHSIDATAAGYEAAYREVKQ